MKLLKTDAIYMYIDISNSRSAFSTLHDGTNILTYLAETINQTYGGRLLTPFTIKDGDAIVGGTTDFKLLINIYSTCLAVYYSADFKNQFRDVPAVANETLHFYFGAGIGHIDTPPTEDLHDTNIINGTSIINAIEASDQAKIITKSQLSQKRSAVYSEEDYCFHRQPFKFHCLAEMQSFGNVINALFFLAFEQLIKSDKQQHLFLIKDNHPEYSNIEIGTELGYTSLSKAAISSRVSVLIANSDYFLYKKVRMDIVNYLVDLQKMMKGADHA